MVKKIILNLSRFIFATVFLFSGFVKAIDPLGSTYKIQDYLASFGPSFDMFSFLAFPGAIFLSALEFIIGFNIRPTAAIRKKAEGEKQAYLL